MVFLVGLVENILPSKKGNMEEETQNLLCGHIAGNETSLSSHTP